MTKESKRLVRIIRNNLTKYMSYLVAQGHPVKMAKVILKVAGKPDFELLVIDVER